ncbi:hypothetical protein ABB37_04601 [Leptomonas pyrrhocoris]|uniref:Calcineurin-like phosphoesterase domain-containing protein n=1 Tax=Leptomonas pyrrhocoris TaxID=157538 RepID=A0A0M9G1L0_LEPPY|nr:hypothetical protein ABB37_04601 [Leptomonas pyrrhocoris]XP_015658767.1 hypothetical protein ABB37_04601 [Leptomonas pyrrhocoris]KPA80327.1 hypothetical protein ABB37_04601 [Leptomonas pyrrhocoris]KPA80328.1 hypothetical protein ABB37_04601 [Leptomonas pyrrhocoris]|eukprot:XP_015658766.1 hypothetical protein ABB37_04601 [Leptomonas pyrrhocoris]
MSASRTVEALLTRLRSPKNVRSPLVFWTVLVLVFMATFIISSFPLRLYTPTVGFQLRQHRQLPKPRPVSPVVTPAGSSVIEGTYHRVVVVGDLHGDLDRLRSVLRAAQVLDEVTDSWRDGCTDILVQLGDVVDRGPDAPALLQLLHRLRTEAAKAGGQVVTLSGHHEMLALMGSTSDIHPSLLEGSSGSLGFRHLYGVGGRYGRMLVEDNLAAVLIGDVVYVHGGLTATYAAYGMEQLNNELWYQGLMAASLSKHVFHSPDSPLRDRSIVAAAMQSNCGPLDEALRALSKKEGITVGAMVVGHSVMEKGKVGSWCNGRLVSADVGLSRYIEGGGYEAYVTVDPYVAPEKGKRARKTVSTASRIHAHYPLGSGVRVPSNT